MIAAVIYPAEESLFSPTFPVAPSSGTSFATLQPDLFSGLSSGATVMGLDARNARKDKLRPTAFVGAGITALGAAADLIRRFMRTKIIQLPGGHGSNEQEDMAKSQICGATRR